MPHDTNASQELAAALFEELCWRSMVEREVVLAFQAAMAALVQLTGLVAFLSGRATPENMSDFLFLLGSL